MIPIQKDQGTPLPPPERAAAPAPTVSVETPVQKAPMVDRLSDIANAFSGAVHQGLSYANARRARSTYRGS